MSLSTNRVLRLPKLLVNQFSDGGGLSRDEASSASNSVQSREDLYHSPSFLSNLGKFRMHIEGVPVGILLL
jgi:hypothetical protein